MRRLRRSIPDTRIELVPLIDVMMALLTFSIISMALMVRADVLDVRIPTLTAGRPASPGHAITVALDAQGRVFVNREPVEPASVAERVRSLRDATPDAHLFVAADDGGRSGDLLALVDRLAKAGLGDFSLVGRPPGDAAEAPPAPAQQEGPPP